MGCIIRLMFECGLRIGETLGLTSDDLVMEQEGNIFVSVAYITNRLSDNKDQQAKTCMKVKDEKNINPRNIKQRIMDTKKLLFHSIYIT